MVLAEVTIAACLPNNGDTKQGTLELMEARLVIGQKEENINAGH